MEAQGKQTYGVGMVWLLAVIEGVAASLCIIQMESLIILIHSPFRCDLCIVFFKGGDVSEVRRCKEIRYSKFPDLD